jgi:peptide-methionine (S)-S-oxide reductase
MSRNLNKWIFLLYFFSIISGITMIINDKHNKEILEQATFGAGCFWCVEAIIERLEGVVDVRSGYTGGKIENPTYDDVCSGKTGHVEVVQVDYNPQIIGFKQLLDIFWKSHDPTTLNRQGGDTGTQYRSAVFYHSDKQRVIAEKSKKKADRSNLYEHPIVTEITRLAIFYPAEEYHQDYYRQNSNAPYCQVAIQPKLKKLFDSD